MTSAEHFAAARSTAVLDQVKAHVDTLTNDQLATFVNSVLNGVYDGIGSAHTLSHLAPLAACQHFSNAQVSLAFAGLALDKLRERLGLQRGAESDLADFINTTVSR